MRRRTVLIAGASAFAAPQAALGQSPSVEGEWGGVLVAGGAQLRLKLAVVKAGGAAQASLWSLDQGNARFEAADVRLDDDRVRAQFPAINASLDLRLGSDDVLEGVFVQGASRPVRFMRDPDFDALATPRAAPFTPETLEALRAQAGSPALAAAALGASGQSAAHAVGLRRQGADAPVTTADRWHIGSITKWMTSTLVARLVETGQLSWTMTVGDLLGDVAPEMRDAYRPMTFAHLLSHRAGLPANVPMATFRTYPREEADARATRRSYAQTVLAMAPMGAAEDTFVYSNAGYVVASVMMEAQLGAPWEALIQEHVFQPLGLETAGFGAPGEPGADTEPSGHGAGLLNAIGVGGRRRAYPVGAPVTDNPAVLGPAGRAHMSLPDLLVFLTAHRDRPPFLSPQNWAMIQTPPFGGDYALGVIVRDGALWHNGSNTLWYAEALVDRGRGVVAAAAANDGVLEHAEPAVSAALASAAEAVR